MSTHSMQEVPMKFAVVRRGEVVEMRRRRLVNPTYEVVAKVAAEFARGKYRLQYTDEDGDVVTMSTQAEWEECVASWDAAQALKIRVELCGAKGWCGSRSRSRSSSSACSRTKQGCRSRSPRRHHGHGHEHHPLRVRAWLAKKEAQAWDVPAEVGVKCANCDCQTTGLVTGFCCKKCMRGKGHHGKRCEQKPFAVVSSSEVDDTKQPNASSSSSDEQCEKTAVHKVQTSEGKGWGALFGFEGCKGFGKHGMHGHFKGHKGHGGKGCKGVPHEHRCKREAASEPTGQKCANCDFATTGIVDLFCCRACMNGRGHGLWCKQQLAKPEETSESTIPGEEVQQESAPVGRHRGCWAWKKAVDPALVGQKCANCAMKTTGVVDMFCCRRCMHGRGHGRRCEQVPFGEAKEATAWGSSEGEQHSEARNQVGAEEEVHAAQAEAPQTHAAQIAKLEEMGFTVDAQVLNALVAADGDVTTVLATMFL